MHLRDGSRGERRLVELGEYLRYRPAKAALDLPNGDARGEGRNVVLQFLQGDHIVIGQYVPAYAERLAELDERRQGFRD